MGFGLAMARGAAKMRYLKRRILKTTDTLVDSDDLKVDCWQLTDSWVVL